MSSYSAEDWRHAITRLLRMTSSGDLIWSRSSLVEGDAWKDVDWSYQCQFKDKIYVISQTRSKNYVDEEEFYWVNGYDLSIFEVRAYAGGVGADAELIASAPTDLSILSNLFEAAEKSFAFQRKALGDLL